MSCWRAGDPQMNLRGARVAHHLHDLQARRAADDAVVHQNDALALDQRTVCVVFQFYPKVADLIAGLDERAAHIVRPNDPELERDARLLCVANRSGRS